jgi:hypothetical protein
MNIQRRHPEVYPRERMVNKSFLLVTVLPPMSPQTGTRKKVKSMSPERKMWDVLTVIIQ